ncbi:MAG: pleD 3 [Firmicutes bacterium]|nr:pleD 3 [Bacillota bacterium]
MEKIFYQYTGIVFGVIGAVLALVVEEVHAYSYLGLLKISGVLPVLITTLAVAGWLLGRLIQTLHVGAYTDALTQLWNRRYFYVKFCEETNRMKRTSAPLCIALVDVDNFKNINDYFGHTTGDNVLVNIAMIIKRRTRSMDIVFRWGGDEFVILFPETNLKQAAKVAERVRVAIAKSSQCSNATISVGLVAVKEKVNEAQVIESVDKMLSQAKKMKNLVVLSDYN